MKKSQYNRKKAHTWDFVYFSDAWQTSVGCCARLHFRKASYKRQFKTFFDSVVVVCNFPTFSQLNAVVVASFKSSKMSVQGRRGKSDSRRPSKIVAKRDTHQKKRIELRANRTVIKTIGTEQNELNYLVKMMKNNKIDDTPVVSASVIDDLSCTRR